MADAKARVLLAALSLTALALAACSRQAEDEMTWARAALERNQSLEIVAADPQRHTFTVRNRDTDELSTVRADQLIAGAAAPGPSSTAPAPAPAAPVRETATAAPAAPAITPPAFALPATAAPAPGSPAEPIYATAPAAAGGAPDPAPAPKVFASSVLQAGPRPRPVPGQILAAGPGYSIEAGSRSSTDDSAYGVEAGSGYGIDAGSGPAAAAKVRQSAANDATVELRHEPIVCQGSRLLHIDNRNLQFDGDAVSAQDGCEIHITNSRIHAAGVGVTARAANVHIDNSLIEGDAASIEVSDGAQIYTTSSKFRGMSRRLDTAAVHDLGGNVWN